LKLIETGKASGIFLPLAFVFFWLAVAGFSCSAPLPDKGTSSFSLFLEIDTSLVVGQTPA